MTVKNECECSCNVFKLLSIALRPVQQRYYLRLKNVSFKKCVIILQVIVF